MRAFLRGFLSCAVGVVVLAPCANAYVLIDDFTSGDYHKQVVDGFDSHNLTNLDTSHSVFGERGADFTILNNPFQTSIRLDFGEGLGSVTSGDNAASTEIDMFFGISRQKTIDLSHEDQFFVDLFTRVPQFSIADEWRITVEDATFNTALNSGPLGRSGGIFFQKNGFSQSVDWSRIRVISFRQKFTSDFGDVPKQYSVTRIYSVPEESPRSLLALGLLLLPRIARGRSKRRVKA